jgi:hypothetical protein
MKHRKVRDWMLLKILDKHTLEVFYKLPRVSYTIMKGYLTAERYKLFVANHYIDVNKGITHYLICMRIRDNVAKQDMNSTYYL